MRKSKQANGRKAKLENVTSEVPEAWAGLEDWGWQEGVEKVLWERAEGVARWSLQINYSGTCRPCLWFWILIWMNGEQWGSAHPKKATKGHLIWKDHLHWHLEFWLGRKERDEACSTLNRHHRTQGGQWPVDLLSSRRPAVVLRRQMLELLSH